MSEQTSLEKAARLTKLTHLLYRNRMGLTVEQMAQSTGVTVRQAYRDLETLEAMGIPLYEPEDGRWAIVAGHFLPPVHFSLDEAITFFLAARLLARYSQDHDPLVIHALAKLATAMPETIANHIQATAATLSLRSQNHDFQHNFATITRAWAERRWVSLRYATADDDEIDQTDFAPYFIEPSAVGFATYIIGWSRKRDALRTIKMERVYATHLLEETYELPATFDAISLLTTAWGIVFAKDNEPLQEVILRFSPEVARRVRETRWHASEERTDFPDGSCELRFRVAKAWEMKPWIRQWGQHWRVLAPPALRQEIACELEAAAMQYRQD